MVKGNQATQVSKASTKYIGFTKVQVRAVNPTRSELNKLLGKDPSEDDKEIVYLSQDQDGNDRVRLSFWLYDEKLDNYFVHSFNLTNKVRLSKDGVKTQYVNNTCTVAWSDVPDNLPDWFTRFLDKNKNELATKEFRKALLGEEELTTLLRTWLGRMTWNDINSSVMIDTKALFGGDYSELQSLVDGDYDTPFVILTGVRTDENDTEKQYQQVYGKAFLPKSFMDYIPNYEKKGEKAFGSEQSKKTWRKFETDVNGDFGFGAYFELSPIKEYDRTKDISASPTTKADTTPANSKY